MTDTSSEIEHQSTSDRGMAADPVGVAATLKVLESRQHPADQNTNSDSASLARLEEYAMQLRRRIWITRGSRLNAYRRLTEANAWSNRATTFLSMYSIVAALAVAVPQFGLSAEQKELAGVALTALSVFTLVLSLLESQRDYAVKAERLHRNALALGALLDRLNLLRSSVTDEATLGEKLALMGAKCDSILERCPENHDPLDYAVFQAQQRREFGITAVEAWWTSHVSARRPFLLFYAFVWLPPLLIGAWFKLARVQP
jgi:hypothetical protein